MRFKYALLLINLFGLLACDASHLKAQRFGGGERGDSEGRGGFRGGRGGFGGGDSGGRGFSGGDVGDRMFGRMDRNQNGRLDPDELSSMPSTMRTMLERNRFDLSQSISREDFVQEMPRIMEGLRSRSGFDRGGATGRGTGDRTSGFDRSRGRGRREEPKEEERVRVTVDLPTKFTDYDKNSDGQIGLYEWERARFAEFLQLDQNGDGFLTPRELVRADRDATGTTSDTAVASRSSFGSRTSTRTSSRSSSSPTGSSSSSSSSGSSARPAVSEASVRLRFRLLDRNKDASLTADEWERSRTTKQTFERAKVTLELPATADQFLEAYMKVTKANG